MPSTIEKLFDFVKAHPNVSCGVGFIFLPPLAAVGMWKLTKWPKWLKLIINGLHPCVGYWSGILIQRP